MRSPFSLQTPKGGAVLETISTKSSISIKNKYSNELLPVVGVIADYMAIWLAEYVSYGLRDFWVPETHFHLSWLSIHVIIPVVYILFLQLHHLYTRRMQFWQVISSIFKSVFYAIALLIFFIYIAQTAASTSRLFVALLWLTSFVFLVADRLLDVWLGHNQIDYAEQNVSFLEKQNWIKKGGQFLERKFFGKQFRNSIVKAGSLS